MKTRYKIRILSSLIVACTAGLLLFNPSQWGSDNAALNACFSARDQSGVIETCAQAIEQEDIYDKERGEAAFQLAMAITSSDAERAIELYTQTTELYPGRTSAFYNRGLIHLGAKSYKLAADDFATVIDRITSKNAAKYSGAYRLRANALEELGEYDKAMADVDRALSFDPNDVRAILTKADILSAQDKFSDALLVLDSAIAAHPKHRYITGLWKDRAWTRTQIGDIDGAFDDLNRALDHGDNSPWTWYWRAKLHARNGDPKTAFADFRKSLEINPNYCRAIRGQKRLIKKLEELAEAAPLMARVTVDSILVEHPEYPKLLHLRFLASSQAGELETALEDINRLIEATEYPDLWFHERALIYKELRQFDLAISDIQRVLENDDVRTEAIAAISQEVAELRQAGLDCAADARLVVSKKLSVLSDSEVILQDFLLTLKTRRDAEDGNWDLVFSSTDQLIEYDPRDARNWIVRGLALAHLERHREAILSYSEALRLIEADEEKSADDDQRYIYALLSRALAHVWLHQFAEAGSDVDSALKAANSEGVKAFQIFLQKTGHYQGPLHGTRDAATTEAMLSCMSDTNCFPGEVPSSFPLHQ